MDNQKQCPQCQDQMTFRSGISKAGKSYAGFFCQNRHCKHVEWQRAQQQQTPQGVSKAEFDELKAEVQWLKDTLIDKTPHTPTEDYDTGTGTIPQSWNGTGRTDREPQEQEEEAQNRELAEAGEEIKIHS